MMDDHKELVEMLKKMPLKEVPSDLTERVMNRISDKKPSIITSIWRYVSQPQSISFKPVYAFGIALLVFGAFFSGMNFQKIPDQVTDNRAVTSQFEPELLENPESAYLVGRALLQARDSEQNALTFLRRAAQIDPQNPEFAYWEGVGYWSNGDSGSERLSYLRGLEADPRNVPLLINLGHNYLSDKHYQDALIAYQKALDLAPENSTAQYNTGLIYRALGMVEDEIISWRAFLQNNRTGTKAFRALQRLNVYDDFSFRAYQIGFEKVILNQQALLDDSLPESIRMNELESVVSVLANNTYLNLEVVSFVENDREAARERAIAVKNLIKSINEDVSARVKLSWFDVPEMIGQQSKKSQSMQSEGLLLFCRLINENEREESI